MKNILLIDTCVWLDMAQKPSLKTLALALKQLLEFLKKDFYDPSTKN